MIIFNYNFTRIRGREGVILSKKKRVWYPEGKQGDVLFAPFL
jgi:hypothetical protein